MPRRTPSARFDEAGVGLDATDTIIPLPLDLKLERLSADIRRRGQVASAIVACARSGLRTRYVGKIGEDRAGKLEKEDREREGVDSHWITSPAGNSQTSFLLIDGQSKRTVLWKREDRFAPHPEELNCEWISGARALLIDGQDTAAAAQAARWTRAGKIPVVGDIDNLYSGVEELLEHIDSPVISREFPERLSGENDLLKSLPRILTNFKCRLIAATLGYLGAIPSRFSLCPRLRVADTTGAGDIFHVAFCAALCADGSMKKYLSSFVRPQRSIANLPAPAAISENLKRVDSSRTCGERPDLAYTQEAYLDALPEFAREDPGENE